MVRFNNTMFVKVSHDFLVVVLAVVGVAVRFGWWVRTSVGGWSGWLAGLVGRLVGGWSGWLGGCRRGIWTVGCRRNDPLGNHVLT